ncbi:MAG: S-adenosylmethionine:tRNA ribosyltransferase-isomerase [Candidatus Kariarchaeaceae archaeon]
MLEIARLPRLGRSSARLMVMNGRDTTHTTLRELVEYIPADSLLVVNDAGTIPASFHGYVGSLPIELRLVRNLDPSYRSIDSWQALIFYDGNWKERTEDRLDPDFLEIGDLLQFGDLMAEVISIDHSSKRYAKIRLLGDTEELWKKIYRFGKPIQYSHLEEELALWDVQTIFASRPVALEAPSASFQLTWDLLDELQKKGVNLVSITHAAGISSMGLQDLEQLLPLEESYWITNSTADLINEYHSRGRPIIAIGTSVTRALESNMTEFGTIKPGQYSTTLIIDQQYHRKVVTGLFTGMHMPEESHMKMLTNFIDEERLLHGYNEAVDLGYMWHEYGDVNLIL